MTNYTQNEWVIEGSAEALDWFEREALSAPSGGRGWVRRAPDIPRCLDLQRLVPPPAGLEGAALHDWRVAQWGTNRPAEPQSYARTAPGRAELVFATAWAQPDGVIAALSGRAPPNLTIRGTALESGNAYAARFTLAGGHLDGETLELDEGFAMLLSGPYVEEE